MDFETQYKNEEWKNKYIRITNRITVIIIIIFAIIHIGGFALRGAWGVAGRLFHIGSSGTVQSADYVDIGSFTAIDADLAMGDLVIEAGEDYAVHVEDFSSDIMPTVKVENGILKLREKKGSEWFAPGSNYGSITVVLPPEAKSSLDLDLDMGNFTASDVNLTRVSIDAAMGGVEFSACELYDVDISANMGSINMEGGSFNVGKFDADMGSVDLKDVKFVSADIDSSMGSVDVSGSFEALVADLSMGSITVKNDNANAKYDIDCSMGSVEVNGKEYGSKYMVE